MKKAKKEKKKKIESMRNGIFDIFDRERELYINLLFLFFFFGYSFLSIMIYDYGHYNTSRFIVNISLY